MRWTQRLRGAGMAVATAMLLGSSLAVPAARAAVPPSTPLTDLVNPFIGTENEGNTYPGAAVPFGMVQFSPDTGHNTGYDYSQNHIRGFSLVHLSGVGCGLGGDLPVLPTTGDVTETDYAKYEAEFSHDSEQAAPGSYKVGLKTGIEAELTATARTGVQRYTFPATDKANVLLNAGQSLHRTISTKVEILDNRTVRTAITGSGFCQDTKPYTVYTVTRFDRPFTTSGTWNGDTVTEGSKESVSTGRGGAFVRFDTTRDRTVEATTALSYVDARGAALNLRSEGAVPSTPSGARRTARGRTGSAPYGPEAAVTPCAARSTRRSTGPSSHPISAVTPTAATPAGTSASTAHRASPTTRTGRCGTPIAPSRSSSPCSRRVRPGTWRSPSSRSTRTAAGCPSGATARWRRTS